jgi:hypothetical protein
MRFRQKGCRGQALVEVTLILPMLLGLTLGAVELSNLIYTYQVMHHLAAQGASMAARLTEQTPADPSLTFHDRVTQVMQNVTDASCPTITRPGAVLTGCSVANDTKWRIIFTRIGPDVTTPNLYVVKDQVVTGQAQVNDNKRVCKECDLNEIIDCASSCIQPNSIPNLDIVTPRQFFYSFEVFYDYSPVTVLGNFAADSFAFKLYERSIF